MKKLLALTIVMAGLLAGPAAAQGHVLAPTESLVITTHQEIRYVHFQGRDSGIQGAYPAVPWRTDCCTARFDVGSVRIHVKPHRAVVRNHTSDTLVVQLHFRHR